jgi:hypothetical protein
MEEESRTRAEGLDLANDRFWGKISEAFQLAFTLLQDLAEEEGIDLDAVVDEPETDEPKKDSNGSAKIALIGIDRSLSAWGELAAQGEEQGAAIGTIVNYLARLRAMVEKEFPRARVFIRPGFDTLATLKE